MVIDAVFISRVHRNACFYENGLRVREIKIHFKSPGILV